MNQSIKCVVINPVQTTSIWLYWLHEHMLTRISHSRLSSRPRSYLRKYIFYSSKYSTTQEDNLVSFDRGRVSARVGLRLKKVEQIA